MKIRMVPRSKVTVSRKSRSKYDTLKDAISKLQPEGDAIRLEYSDQKELNSIRNIAYTFNREQNGNVKSTTNATERSVFFFVENK